MMRIDNLELRRTQSLKGEDYWEIIKWEKNSFYGQEDKYVRDGGFYRSKEHPNVSISAASFREPEYCFTLAYFKGEMDEESGVYRDCPSLVSVGMRPFELNKEEFEAYIQLAKQAYCNFGYGPIQINDDYE